MNGPAPLNERCLAAYWVPARETAIILLCCLDLLSCQVLEVRRRSEEGGTGRGGRGGRNGRCQVGP